MSVYEAVFGGDLPDTTAIISGDEQLSYPQLAENIEDAAANLFHHGVRPNDVIGIQLANGADFAVLFHAVLRLGAVVAPLGTHLPTSDRDSQLRAVNAKLLLGLSEARKLRRPRGAHTAPTTRIDPEQLACLPFSSGTTGTPKAVMLPHRALAANVEQFRQVLPLRPGQTCLSVLPFSHIYGLTALLNVPLALRARVVAQDFQRESFIKAHETHQVDLTFIAPPLATLLANDPLVPRTDFSTLKTVISGAAPLNPETARAAAERVDARIMQGFGLTEAAPVTHLASQPGLPISSIGHPLPGTSISVRHPDTHEPAAEGEMWVRGPQVMAGYLGDPEATTRTLVDGWLRTGDLVRRNPDGSFEVVDRIKDIIKYHGFQVSPVKLERVILDLPDVHDCAVTRGYDPRGEEQPEAFVVVEPGSPLSAAEIKNWVAAHVAPYERVRAVHLVARIPRSAAGKILRRQLG
ncbi:AMP-binding protein [Corynebacterium sp. H128]|uniref:class I adenylate-forming enzyme family protein n=1 Tax=unclassified Corynebacterium TaxID=2624378 RepID=UPI0030AC13CD